MLPLMIAGGALTAAGTAGSMIAARQRQKATNKALNAYEAAASQRAEREKAALAEEQAAAYGLRDLRYQGLSRQFGEMGLSNAPVDTSQQRQGLAQALSDARGMAPEGSGAFAFQGAPRTAQEQAQAGDTAGRNADLASLILQGHQDKVQAAQKADTQRRASLRELLLQAKGADVKRKFQIAKALRDLDWQHQQIALQGDLERAQNKGQWLGLLSGLGQQAGGMTMAAGAGMGGEEAAAGAAAETPQGIADDFYSHSYPVTY